MVFMHTQIILRTAASVISACKMRLVRTVQILGACQLCCCPSRHATDTPSLIHGSHCSCNCKWDFCAQGPLIVGFRHPLWARAQDCVYPEGIENKTIRLKRKNMSSHLPRSFNQTLRMYTEVCAVSKILLGC